MAPKRESESIHEFLSSRYPSHRKLEDGVKSLASAGFHKLDDLANVNFRSLRSHLSALFCIALRDYMRPDATDHVEDDCTLEWGFECTEVTVTLRQENEILELPAQYSPIVPDSEEEIIEQAPDEEDLGEELEMMENAYNDLPEPAQPGLLELKMYVFSSKRSKRAVERIWCTTSGTKILERRSYVSLQERVQARWDAGVKAVLLVGVPGIGKTGFIICMLLSLMKQRKAIALQTKGGDFFLFEPQPVEAPGTGEAYACLKLRNKSVLYDPEVYFLVDGKMPDVPSFSCKSLLATIPKLLNFQDYEKDGRGDLVLLPVWSAAEIALAWQEIFDPRLPALAHPQEVAVENAKLTALLEARKKLTLDVVKERYKKWGGTARFVLETPHVDLDEVVRGLQSIQQTVELVGRQVADGDHPSHKVVHQRVKQGYASYEYMFASPYLSEAARKKLKESTSGALRLFLSFKGLAAHGVNGCKGNVFHHEFKSLARGVQQFKVRQVYEDTSLDDQEMVFNFGQPFEVPKLESLPVAAPVNQIIWPESAVEETIDAMKIVRLAGRLDVLEVYQVTLSSARHAHGLKYAAMLKVMHKFGIPPHRVKVYIVTTSELYPEAGYQNWRKSRNLVLRDERILRRLVGITQYVLDSGVIQEIAHLIAKEMMARLGYWSRRRCKPANQVAAGDDNQRLIDRKQENYHTGRRGCRAPETTVGTHFCHTKRVRNAPSSCPAVIPANFTINSGYYLHP
ncbi:hypothetical protein SELMODRAFT_426662 [Selaginella moellendorffii]|uniref:Uncharacterized protein n=1 Tax=Selaginella moellendorffii TaxID=88036 RepID=D8SX36_SELML|nr:hypothetical protein SELMODRAFT_426662 [Selaginella moellendorffii]